MKITIFIVVIISVYTTTLTGQTNGIPCPDAPTVTDIDGNTYTTTLINGQCWMAENLKTTTYRDGTPIPKITDTKQWVNLNTGAYVWYDNDSTWKDLYGALQRLYRFQYPRPLPRRLARTHP